MIRIIAVMQIDRVTSSGDSDTEDFTLNSDYQEGIKDQEARAALETRKVRIKIIEPKTGNPG